MLFESPFYVDKPVAIGLFLGTISLILLWLLFVFNRRGSFHEIVVAYFHRRQPGVPMEKWTNLGRILFVFLTLVTGAMALYCVSVATGVVKNKDNSLPPGEFERIKKFYDEHRLEKKPAPRNDE